MTPPIPPEFIQVIPKTDIHLHLDGSLRLSTLIDLAREQKVELPSMTEEGLRETVFKDSYRGLPDYLAGFAYTCAVMQDEESLERIAYELAADNLAEGVRYIEVRFAPQLHIRRKFQARDVVGAVCRGLQRAKMEHNKTPEVAGGEDIPFEFGIILCALRFFNANMSDYYRSLYGVMSYAADRRICAMASLETARLAAALAHEEGLPVVGFDLAGAEAGFPAGDIKRRFNSPTNILSARRFTPARPTDRNLSSRPSPIATPTALDTGPTSLPRNASWTSPSWTGRPMPIAWPSTSPPSASPWRSASPATSRPSPT